jgi:uncharacterized membrane protein YvlD (DUF360 family)
VRVRATGAPPGPRRLLTGMSAASLLFGPLSPDEHLVEERLRTLALCVCALGVVGAALAYLRSVLVPFVLAVALKQMLAPIVNFLGLRLPRFAAVLLTLSFATALIVGIALILADSVRQFSAHANEYSAHIERLLNSLVSWMDTQGINHSVRLSSLKNLGDKLPLTTMILNGLRPCARASLRRVLAHWETLAPCESRPFGANGGRAPERLYQGQGDAFPSHRRGHWHHPQSAPGGSVAGTMTNRARRAEKPRFWRAFVEIQPRWPSSHLLASQPCSPDMPQSPRNVLLHARRPTYGRIESHPRRSLACSPFGATSSRMWER